MGRKVAIGGILLVVLLAMVAATGAGAKHGKKKKKKNEALRVFAVKEAGVRLMLTASWFPVPSPPSLKGARLFASIKELGRITVTLVPSSARLDEGSFAARLAELHAALAASHPDFSLDEGELVEGEDVKLHVVGSWTSGGEPMQVCVEAIPVAAGTAVVLLETQEGREESFAWQCDLLRLGTMVDDKPKGGG